MPLGEEYASTLAVTIGGTPLPPDMRGHLVSAYVDDSVHVPSMFVLRFSDPEHRVLPAIKATIGAQVTVAVQQSGEGSPVELIDGDITALEQEIDERGTFSTVRGLDARYRLQSGADVAAFARMTVTDVVKQVAQDAGLISRVDSFGPSRDHIAKDRESGWEFLCRLARNVGAVIWMEGRTLHFAKASEARHASTGTDSTKDPGVIQGGKNLISLRATITAAAQVPEVQARSWDPKQKATVTASAPTSTTSAALQATPAALAQQVHGSKHVVGRSDLGLPARTQDLARVTNAARAGGFAEIEGTVRGNPALAAGSAVHLVEVGPTFAGKYVLTAVRHNFDPGEGYRTTLTAADASDRSVYGVISGAGCAAPGGPDPHHSVLTAVVTNAKDPDGLGRIKVKFPVFSEVYESWWVRPLQLGAGAARGVSWLPEVGDEVLVAFGQGSFEEPYVLGGLYNGRDKAGQGWPAHVNASDGSIKRRALTSRNGMVVEFVEDGQNDTLTVSTNDGKQHLTLTQTGSKGIVLVSQGPLDVKAEQDITVTGQQNITMSTSTGDFKVKAVNVTLEATSTATVKGAQVVAQGQATAEVKAVNVKVSASAAAELAGQAMATIRGAMVKIN